MFFSLCLKIFSDSPRESVILDAFFWLLLANLFSEISKYVYWTLVQYGMDQEWQTNDDDETRERCRSTSRERWGPSAATLSWSAPRRDFFRLHRLRASMASVRRAFCCCCAVQGSRR